MIDVHTHCLQHSHWGPEWDENWAPVYKRAWVNVEPDVYDREMQAAGVSLAFVFGMRATKAGVLTPNRFVAGFCEQTTTRTVGFMSLDLSDPDVMEQFEEGYGLGLRGIKLYPVLAHFDPRDAMCDLIYRAAAERGIPILWHMGASPSAAGDLQWADPLLVDAVAAKHPDLVQIIAHLAHPWQRETMLVLRKNPRVFSDVSASWARPFDAFHAFVRAQEWGVVDRLLFGSDYPMWAPSAAVAGLQALKGLSAGNLPGIEPETIDGLFSDDLVNRLGVSG